MAPSRTKLYENDPKWVWKFVVRVSAIVFALISIGIIAGDHGNDEWADMDFDTLTLLGITPVRSDLFLLISALPLAPSSKILN
jgi:hypothetical protein